MKKKFGLWFCAAWAPIAFGAMSAACADTGADSSTGEAVQQTLPGLREINDVPAGDPSKTTVIAGATLIDGRGDPAVTDALVVVRGNRIVAAGPRQTVPIPDGAETVDARGLTVMPGLVDAFFALDGEDLPAIVLRHGITTLKEPGQWIEAYGGPIGSGVPIPRLFLTGPVLDSPPPAYPTDSFLVRDDDEASVGVHRFVDQGASAIKAYYRLPLGLVRTVTEVAHRRGVPVTAHLEIVDARDAIRAGVDGIDFVTSFGTSLLPTREAEKYRQAVIADNAARQEGRYQVWSSVDMASPRVNEVLDLALAHRTVIVATLEPFERRQGDPNTTEMHLRGFQNMLKFVGRAHERGVRVAVGSHSQGPHGERGWGYQHELELLVESGMSPMDAIVAGTMRNAQFLRTSDRLGTIEKGKLADIVIIEGDPLADIRVMRNVRRVMLNGKWVAEPAAARNGTGEP